MSQREKKREEEKTMRGAQSFKRNKRTFGDYKKKQEKREKKEASRDGSK